MAYFTRSKMVLMALEMYDYVERFKNGATEDRAMDMNVLVGFQQKALVLGEYLESMGMDYSDVVKNIETACNLVYEMAENLDDTNLVMDHHKKLCTFCQGLVKAIKERIIEISRIDVYDFRNLANDSKEAKTIENEIDNLYYKCFKVEPSQVGIEFSVPIVVGNY